MFFHPAAFFFSRIASRYCVSCETTFVCIDVQDRRTAQRHAVQCFIDGTKTVLVVTRPAEALYANPFEIKPGNVTDKRYASHQRNMAMLQAPLVTTKTSIHSFLVRLSEQVNSFKPFPKKQYSLNQITAEQERSHTSGN